MQLQYGGCVITEKDISVSLNPSGNGPFAVLKVGRAEFYVSAPEEADLLIAAATEAKRLLAPERVNPFDLPLGVPFCCVQWPSGTATPWICTQPQGHDGDHEAWLPRDAVPVATCPRGGAS